VELIVRHGGDEHRVHLERDDEGNYVVVVGDARYEVDVAMAGNLLSLNVDDGRQYEVAVHRIKPHSSFVYEVSTWRGLDVVELMDPLTHLLDQTRRDTAGARRVMARMPGRVVQLLVEEGQAVEKGQGIVVVEAMKMKNEIQAEASGQVARIFVEPGQNVESGDPLFEIA
jgi:glutaconyl-CoA/methylmalonyl-CoA decarboxylase subunit gamma